MDADMHAWVPLAPVAGLCLHTQLARERNALHKLAAHTSSAAMHNLEGSLGWLGAPGRSGKQRASPCLDLQAAHGAPPQDSLRLVRS